MAVAFSRPQIAQRLLFEAACFGVDKLIFYPSDKSDSSYAKSALYASGEYGKWLEKGAEQACSTMIPDFKIAENFSSDIPKAALDKAWEATFDMLCSPAGSLSPTELNALAGVIQKLSAIKCEPARENPYGVSGEVSISESAMRKIEAKLKLI